LAKETYILKREEKGVSFVGLFCKRDMYFEEREKRSLFCRALLQKRHIFLRTRARARERKSGLFYEALLQKRHIILRTHARARERKRETCEAARSCRVSSTCDIRSFSTAAM